MPASSPRIGAPLENVLRTLGQRLRDRRKELGVSAVATAESAGMSRVTLYRIEKGEASVAMGAYISVISALGLEVVLVDPLKRKLESVPLSRVLPQKIRLAEYPKLKRLAWQLKNTEELSPQDALNLYERNWRHIDFKSMNAFEHELFEARIRG